MLSFLQAIEIAETVINNHHYTSDDELIIVEDEIIERPYAWIFPYTSKRWLESGDIYHAIGGNAPIFVNKQNGRVSTFLTGLSIEQMIDAFEEQNRSWSLKILIETYSDTAKLLALKNLLDRTQSEVMELKSSNAETVDMGAKTRLIIVAGLLKTSGISSKIELTVEIE